MATVGCGKLARAHAAVGCGLAGAAVAAFTARPRARRQLRCVMAMAAASQEEQKKLAGNKAVDDYVRSGTVIGLGTGSTVAYAMTRLSQKLKSGELKDIIAVATSTHTKEKAMSLGIPLATLDTHFDLDVAIDSADQVDPALNLVKGFGSAFLREKIAVLCAKKFIVIVDESKLCKGLGPGFPVPVEVVPFCHERAMREISELPALKGCKPILRLSNVADTRGNAGMPALTDDGNYIVDLHFTEPIKDPRVAGTQLKATVGVIDHGLFAGMTTACIVAGKDGISVKEGQAIKVAPEPLNGDSIMTSISRLLPTLSLLVGCAAFTFQVGVLYPWHMELDKDFGLLSQKLTSELAVKEAKLQTTSAVR